MPESKLKPTFTIGCWADNQYTPYPMAAFSGITTFSRGNALHSGNQNTFTISEQAGYRFIVTLDSAEKTAYRLKLAAAAAGNGKAKLANVQQAMKTFAKALHEHNMGLNG